MGRRFTDGQPRTVALLYLRSCGNARLFSLFGLFGGRDVSSQRGFNFFDAGGHIPFQFVDPETQNSPSGGGDLRIAPVVVEFSVTGEGGRQSERPRAVPDESASRRVRTFLRENARRRTQDSQHERSNRVRRQLRQRSVPAARMSPKGGSSSLARFYISPIRAVTRNRTALHFTLRDKKYEEITCLRVRGGVRSRFFRDRRNNSVLDRSRICCADSPA